MTPAGVKQAMGRAWPLLVLASLLLCGFGPPTLVDSEFGPATRLSVGDLRAWAEAQQLPDMSAAAYMIYDVKSEQVLMARHSDTARPPASLTKLMTALLVFEQANLNAEVSIQEDDLMDGATMGLATGETVTVTDLLWGLLLPSGNDAAVALARHMGGTVDEFVASMNSRAEEMGLAQTTFRNPHGLDADGHVSSAADMLAITKELWQYPLFRSMVGTAQVTLGDRTLRSTNEWLADFSAAVGVKTGTTDTAGECLIAAVEIQGRTLFLVILGSTERYLDAERLYDAYVATFAWTTPSATSLSILNRLYTPDGDVRYLHATGAPPVVLQHGTQAPAIRAYRRLTLTPDALQDVARGETVGRLEWFAGAEPVGTQALVVR